MISYLLTNPHLLTKEFVEMPAVTDYLQRFFAVMLKDFFYRFYVPDIKYGNDWTRISSDTKLVIAILFCLLAEVLEQRNSVSELQSLLKDSAIIKFAKMYKFNKCPEFYLLPSHFYAMTRLVIERQSEFNLSKDKPIQLISLFYDSYIVYLRANSNVYHPSYEHDKNNSTIVEKWSDRELIMQNLLMQKVQSFELPQLHIGMR